MIHWIWLPIAIFISVIFGYVLCAILSAGQQSDEHIQKLIDHDDN